MSLVTSVYQGTGHSKIYQIQIHGKNLVLPTYFPAISSAETRFMLEPLLEAILRSGYPRLLVSAYDLAQLPEKRHQNVHRILSNYKENNFVFLDSGTFESFWFNDKQWSFSKYKKQLSRICPDLYTSFDSVPTLQQSYEDIEHETFNNIRNSHKLKRNNSCLFACHGQNPNQLVKLVKNVVKSEVVPEMIGIPERDCGKTIEDKIKTVQKIRDILDEFNSKIVFHILGLGNPLTMALLTFSGANSFDSVDWSRWIVDRKTFQFTDLANLPLLHCSCKACKTKQIDYSLKAIFHNLLFYQDFILQLQQVIIDRKEIGFLKRHLDKAGFSKIVKFFKS